MPVRSLIRRLVRAAAPKRAARRPPWPSAALAALGCLIALAVAPRVGWADEGEREAFEREVERQLEERAPAALPLLREAEAAREASRLEEARELYARLDAEVPGFDHAERRLCIIESALGNRTRALELCRSALARGNTAENKAALAGTLASAGDSAPTEADLREALRLAGLAIAEAPRSASAHATMCALALELELSAALVTCSGRLRELAPELMPTWFYSAVAAANEGYWSDARVYLERARELGLPDDVYESMSVFLDEHEPVWPIVWKPAALVIAGWLAFMLVLVAIGAVLSWRTSRAAVALTGVEVGAPVTVSDRLRVAYRAVLQVSCVAYYVSIPIVLAVVVLTGGGILYGFWAAGVLPVKLAAIVVILTIVTVGAILKSLWVRRQEVEPGKRVDLAEHPKLAEVLGEVARQVGTRPVDTVYLTPGTDIAVFERGGVVGHLRGQSERCLILGAAVLDGMPLPAFKAILAHEYGHFGNRDTAGGGFALAVRRSLLTMGQHLAAGGSAAWYNPAWLFFQVFYRVFLRISHGASRLQEILADRWAVASYGARNFEVGLRHAIGRSVQFDVHVDRTLDEVIEAEAPLANIYRYQPRQPVTEASVEEQVAEIIDAAPSQYDSHPRPADRIRWAHAMGAPEPDPADDVGHAWELLEERDRLEREMTEEIRDRVWAQCGVTIAAG